MFIAKGLLRLRKSLLFVALSVISTLTVFSGVHKNTYSDKNTIRLTYTFAEPEFKEKAKGVYVLNVDELRGLEEKNRPKVPYYVSQIAIPQGMQIADVKVKLKNPQNLKIQGTLFVDSLKDSNGVVLTLDEPNWTVYPALNHDTFCVAKCRGVEFVNLTLFPIQIIKNEHKICYYTQIDVVVKLKPLTHKSGLKVRVNKQIKKMADNPEVLFEPEIITKKSAKAEPDSLCDPAVSFQYLIITSASMKAATDEYSISKFAAYKNSKGVTTHIVTTNEIYAKYTGRDNPEKIRNFIKDAYNNWEIDYVLLAGDVEHVPARFMYARKVSVAADMYYGCLDGDFNANNNANWGEKADDLDFLFDVYVGRASANSTSEMSHFVYKTITYDQSPINASYHTKMVQYNQNAGGVGNTTSWSNAYRGKDSDISAEYYYLTDAQADAKLIPRLNTANLGYYLGASHGLFNSIGNIKNIEANALRSDDQFIFMATIACLAGRFDKDCVAEHLTTHHRNGGAFAGFFNSHDAYAPQIIKYLNQMRDKYFGEDVKILGELRSEIATYYSTSEYNSSDANRYQAYEYNLFGDPQLTWKMKDSEPVDVLLDFDDDASTCLDASSNNNHAALLGGAIKNGGRLKLGGANACATVSHNKWNPMGNQMELTIAAHVYANSFSDNAGVIVKGGSKNPFALTLTKDGSVNFSLNKNAPTNGLKTGAWTSTGKLTAQTWHHVAVVMTYETSQIAIYIDGKLDKSFALPSGWMIGFSNEPLYLGLNKANGNSYFDGFMDNVKIYSNNRSAAEISTWAAAKESALISTGLAHVATGNAVEGFSTNQAVYAINRADNEDLRFCISAECKAGFNGSVVFECNGDRFVDNSAPFASYAENDSLFNTLLQDTGKHVLTVKTYMGKDGKGFVMDEKSIEINLFKESGAAIEQIMPLTDMNLYPNPVKNNNGVTVSFKAPKSGVMYIKLLNALAQEKAICSLSVHKGNYVSKFLAFDGNLNKGVWFVGISDESNTLMAFKKLIVL